MARRWLSGLALALCVVLGTAAPASAHVEAGNNGVSAVLHIVPEDSPTAGQPTLLDFAFASSGTNFSIIGCGCQLAVAKDGKAVSTAFIEPADQTNSNGQASVTFPDQGVYDLTASGTAGVRHFAIKYVVRVNPAGGAANVAAGVNVVMVSLSSLAVIWLLGYYNMSRGGRYAPEPVQPSLRKPQKSK